MGVRGSFSQLAQLQATMQQSLAGALKQRLLEAAAREARAQVALGFRESRAPDGSPWAPLATARKVRGISRRGRLSGRQLARLVAHQQGGGDRPLRKTGRLANSFTAKATATGIVVGTNVSYAPYHQNGTHGHKAHSRHQVVTKRGRFMRMNGRMTQKQLARIVAATQQGQTRTLNFQAGGGKIPARPMVPEGGFGPVWGPSIEKAVDVAFKDFFSKIAK